MVLQESLSPLQFWYSSLLLGNQWCCNIGSTEPRLCVPDQESHRWYAVSSTLGPDSRGPSEGSSDGLEGNQFTMQQYAPWKAATPT